MLLTRISLDLDGPRSLYRARNLEMIFEPKGYCMCATLDTHSILPCCAVVFHGVVQVYTRTCGMRLTSTY